MEAPVVEGKAAVLVPEEEKLTDDKMNDKHGSSIAVSSNITTPVAESPKVPVMASKSGMNFVIPRNKIFGAMVPVTKPSKWEPCEPKKEDPIQPSRRTKWGLDQTQDAVVKRGRALALQTRAEQIAAQLESGNLEIDNNEGTRSPSPPPIYDALGHRMNTREGRKREQLDLERREAIGECLKLNPSYKPPSGFKAVSKEAKLFIPAKDYPGYNFIGLILGPRGNTQKRMEAETGTKITIRGKGAVKEGKLQAIRRDGKEVDGAFEDLHVHITADTYEKVDAAVAIIEPLLTPISEDRNTHKMKQLRELAEMNGTVRDFTRACTLCGDIGHREWQCPKDKLTTFQAKVTCRFCGDGGHPSIDCPLKLSGQGKVLDKEYLNFLEELGSGLGGIDTSAHAANDSDVHPPGLAPNSVTRPMLLTASGALPMPPRWMFSGSGSEAMTDFFPRGTADGASDIGGFPRFPFPIPPFGRPGRGGFNFFLPPFFHPGLIAAFFGGRSPPQFPGQGFPPRMPLDPRAMFSFFRGRFPFPPFGLRPDMRPPASSNTPDNQQSTGNDQRAQAVDLVEGGGTQAKPEMYGELQATNGTLNTSQSQDSSIVQSAKSSMATSPISSDAASSYSSAMASSYSSVSIPSSSSAEASTMPTFSSTVTIVPTFPSITPPTSLPPAAPVLPHSVLPPSAPPPAMPLTPALPAVSSSFTIPVSPVRGVMPSVRPALPSIRPAGPAAAPLFPSLAHTALSSGSNFLSSGVQTPSFSTVGDLGQASSVARSSWDGTGNVISPVPSNVPRPPQPWADITVAAQPSWPQAQHPRAPASPQQSSQVFSWQQQIPGYSSQAAAHEPSKSMGYPPPPLPFSTQSNQVASMSFPTHMAGAASNNFSFIRPQGTAHFLTPPLPPASGPIPIPPPPPLLASHVQSSTQTSSISIQPVFSSFTPVYPPPQDHFASFPPSSNPNIQTAPVSVIPPPHSSGFSNTSFLPPQIRPVTASNLSPPVPMGDHRPNFSFTQRMPVPSHTFSFQPQETQQARSQPAYVSEKSSSFPTPEISTVRSWQPPYIQASMSPTPDSFTAAVKSPLFAPQTVSDKENTYDYNPTLPMPPHSVHPVLHQQREMLRTASTAYDQSVAVGSNFLGATGINPLSNVRPHVQQVWVQPQTGRGQNWPENRSSTGISETEEVDPEYEKLMASVGVI